MPLSGGPADKIGNRYENMWAVLQMARVMAEKAESIRLEPPGEEGIGAEFWVQTREGREYHQAKLQAPGRGNWTVARLDAEGVLKGFRTHLEASDDASCVFVSTHSAHPLDELADRARGAMCPSQGPVEPATMGSEATAQVSHRHVTSTGSANAASEQAEQHRAGLC